MATADDGGDGNGNGGRRRERSMTAVRGSGSRRQSRGAAAKMAVMEDDGNDSQRSVIKVALRGNIIYFLHTPP